MSDTLYGKGRKLRDVSVPEAYLPYLIRYRNHLGLEDLPQIDEKHAIVSKIRGKGGMSARHLRRLVQQVFDQAVFNLQRKDLKEDAKHLQAATSHWLRHTGASMDVEHQRDVKYLSEDLGHATLATTDRIYVQSDIKKRAESGKYRDV